MSGLSPCLRIQVEGYQVIAIPELVPTWRCPSQLDDTSMICAASRDIFTILQSLKILWYLYNGLYHPVSPFWFAARASISLHLSTNTNINRSLYRNININISMSLIARGSIDIYRYRSIYQPKLLQCWRHQEVATLRLTKHTTVVPNEQCQQLGKSLEKMCILKIPIDYDNDNPNLLFFFSYGTRNDRCQRIMLGYITMFDVETPFDF